jgi:hypothetical protein
MFVGGCGEGVEDTEPAAPSNATTSAVGAGGSGSGGSGGSAGNRRGPLGRVFEATPDDGAAVDLPLTGLAPGSKTLHGSTFHIHSCSGYDCFVDLEELAVANDAGDFLYDAALDPPSTRDPAAEVNAYYHLERFASRFEALGFPPIDPDTHIVVGFRYDFDGDGHPDEFWAGATDVLGGPGLVMGVVGSRNLAYDPDVFGHELMHLFQAKSSHLDPYLAPTGLNPVGRAIGEGTADYYSCTTMGDPDVGEYSAAAFGGPYLSSVDNDAACPGDLVGESHHDGQILSGALWELRELLGADRVDEALREMLVGLAPGPDWPGVTAALRASLAERASAEELAGVDAVLDARGLPTCEPIVTLSPDAARRIWITSHDDLLDPKLEEPLSFDSYPAGLQLALAVPPGASTITLTFAGDDDAPDLADLTVHLRSATPVEYVADRGMVSVTSDVTWDDATVPMVLDATSQPRLFAAPLYIAIASHGDGDGFVEVSAAVE